MMLLTELPSIILLNILSQVNPNDIAAVALVSKSLRDSAEDDLLWEELTILRYGHRVAHATRHLYDSFKLMMQDDNRKGALPSLHGLWKSNWKYNGRFEGRGAMNDRHGYGYGNGNFYCCCITSVQWDRMTNHLLLYLDARGSANLRRPETSGLWRGRPDAENLMTFLAIDTSQFTSLLLPPVHNRRRRGWDDNDGHFQGVLRIDATQISQPGPYQFCYATRSLHGDYRACTLFTLEHGQTSLMDVLTSGFSVRDTNPFDADTPEVERQRWEPHVLPTRDGNVSDSDSD